MALRKNLKINYYGFLGLLGFMGFEDPWLFLFFLFFLFFFVSKNITQKKKSEVPASTLERIELKEKSKNKILKFGAAKDKITNNEVQKLLGVSDATAERYLDELEKEGKIKQIGGAEKDTYYTKI